MSYTAIQVENLGKLYRIGARERYKTLRDTLSNTCTAPWHFLRSTFNQGVFLNWRGEIDHPGALPLPKAGPWYAHVASAFPLAHHYQAVLAWGP